MITQQALLMTRDRGKGMCNQIKLKYIGINISSIINQSVYTFFWDKKRMSIYIQSFVLYHIFFYNIDIFTHAHNYINGHWQNVKFK